jgi:hypothetical protein
MTKGLQMACEAFVRGRQRCVAKAERGETRTADGWAPAYYCPVHLATFGFVRCAHGWFRGGCPTCPPITTEGSDR